MLMLMLLLRAYMFAAMPPYTPLVSLRSAMPLFSLAAAATPPMMLLHILLCHMPADIAMPAAMLTLRHG